ncbi:amidohydrolase family protein [Affinibrenneria salicis]|uniref:Amidohydrolase family protein n=1 Tax=Affinibrenneria salicis TaxID=2590031 RepID=A0A5J5FTH5_9GAMM|nr:amidohydrolase family protein [Affinibrenneria salicis]KAA8996913.1 amidohydrolase family protein [Affinibrenneria salicis]
MSDTLTLLNARLAQDSDRLHTLHIAAGRFVAALDGAPTRDLGGKLVLPGLIETHIHLDKACILARCELRDGTLEEAIRTTSAAKADFTEEDVYRRGAAIIEQAIMQGTSWMRPHVEIDPLIGLTGFRAVKRLRDDYRWAIDLSICVFPQEGLLNNPGTEALLCAALADGADLLGGCPYTDSDPPGQLRRLFELAQEWRVDLDLHFDFDLRPDTRMLEAAIAETQRAGMAGRVTLGHVTRLSTLDKPTLLDLARRLAAAGIHITALPATDLFLTGRDHFCNKPRGVAPLALLDECGVTCSLSSNNIGNPFTPFGDASLVRQANLFANVGQLGTPADMLRCLAWISTQSARLMRLTDYGLTPGCRADFAVFDVRQASEVVAGIAPPVMGFKAGRQTFERPAARLLHQ